MSEIKTITLMLEPATQDSPGRVEYAYYRVDGDMLTMTDENGKPIKGSERQIDDPQTAQVIATKIAGDMLGNRMSEFNRPIHYPRLTVV